MVRYYYGAPLPDYLYEKYCPQPVRLSSRRSLKESNKDNRQLTTDDEKSEDYIRFENFLAGTINEFIGRGAPRSNTEAHLRHLKQMNNPVDILRYVKGVVFPGKAFMVEKYLNQFTMHNAPLGSAAWLCQECIIKEEDGNQFIIHNAEFIIKERKKKLCIKYWWLWYGYRWWVALRALVGLRR